MRKKNAVAICQYCKKEFPTYQNEINRGKSKYCSISCGVAFRNKSKAISPVQVFFSNISHDNHPDKCWIYKVGKRYGKMKVQDKYISAHRFSYELFYGEIPEDKVICHNCDRKLCVNPDHLFIGSQKDNIQDMFKKDRANRTKGSSHHWAQLNEKQVSKIKMLLNKGVKIKILSEKYNVAYSLIAQIRQGKSWKHIEPEKES